MQRPSRGQYTDSVSKNKRDPIERRIAERYRLLVDQLGEEHGRPARGWKTKVAQALGVDPTYVTKISKGQREVGLAAAERAARHLGITLDFFTRPAEEVGEDLPHYTQFRVGSAHEASISASLLWSAEADVHAGAAPSRGRPRKMISESAKAKGQPALHVLHSRDNKAWAQRLRDLADRVENSPESVGAYAAFVVYEDGSVGTEFGAVRNVMLVGALEHLKHRVLDDMDREV